MDRGRVVEMLKEALGDAAGTDQPIIVITAPVYVTLHVTRGRKTSKAKAPAHQRVRLVDHPSVTPLRQS